MFTFSFSAKTALTNKVNEEMAKKGRRQKDKDKLRSENPITPVNCHIIELFVRYFVLPISAYHIYYVCKR